MAEALEIAANLAVLVFVVSCMTSAGLGLTLADIFVSLRRPRLVALALAANFVAAPFIALGLTRLIPIDRPYEVGLLLLGGAAGAPFLPKLVETSGGDLAFAVGLMLLLTVGSVGFMPVALPLLIPGLAAEPWPILRPLLFTMLVPLALGVATRRWATAWSERLRPAVRAVSNVTMVVAVGLLVGLNFDAMVGTFGSGAIASGVLFVGLSYGVGYVSGGSDRRIRSVLALGSGQRNIAAALVVGTQNFPDPGVNAMLIVTTLAGVVVLLGLSRLLAPPIVLEPTSQEHRNP